MTRPATLLVSDSCEPTRASTRCSSARRDLICVSSPAPPDRAERARFSSAEIWPLRLVICDCAALTCAACAFHPLGRDPAVLEQRLEARHFGLGPLQVEALQVEVAAQPGDLRLRRGDVLAGVEVGGQALLFELLHLGPRDVHFLVVAGGRDRAEHLPDGDHLASFRSRLASVPDPVERISLLAPPRSSTPWPSIRSGIEPRMLQTMTPIEDAADGGQGQPSHRGGDLHEDVEALGRCQLVERRLPEQGVFRHGRNLCERLWMDDSETTTPNADSDDDAAGAPAASPARRASAYDEFGRQEPERLGRRRPGPRR